ncbi:hypothetical protein RFI_13308 [Reticulomyxa filosa]|uniref:Cell morphogenesis protein C-terminal domain-containing protein n=1 Tax=Reticulomyxa filosa TaxID=46433 RepID=X6NC43_RETFI|nr:hypothetical protein RFI_13308 [Reticulomyxa filosa]|eukprot:ETO23860.1 hypothetical protein RFI_13308 [Reticulomyxa filosa]
MVLLLCYTGLELVGLNLDPAQNPQYFVEMESDWETRDEDRKVTERDDTQQALQLEIDEKSKDEVAEETKALDTPQQSPVKMLISVSTEHDEKQDRNVDTPQAELIEANHLNLSTHSLVEKPNRSFTQESNDPDFVDTSYAIPMDDMAYNDEDARKQNAAMEIEMQMEAVERDGLPENFWNYCEEWTPRFEGVQQYLLQVICTYIFVYTHVYTYICVSNVYNLYKKKMQKGFLRPRIEDMCFNMMKDALITKMDNIMDRTNLRPLLALLSILPYICYHSRHSPEKLTDLPRLFRRLAEMLSVFSKKLSHKFRELAKSRTTIEEDSFLREICPMLTTHFFDSYAKVAANYLEGLLESPGMECYHAVIFKICRYFLESREGFLLCFEKIIAKAHKSVSGGKIPREVSDTATELVKTAIEQVKANKEQHSPDEFIDVSPFPEAGLKFIIVSSFQLFFFLIKNCRYIVLHLVNYKKKKKKKRQVSRRLWQIMAQCPIMVDKTKKQNKERNDIALTRARTYDPERVNARATASTLGGELRPNV